MRTKGEAENAARAVEPALWESLHQEIRRSDADSVYASLSFFRFRFVSKFIDNIPTDLNADDVTDLT